MAKRNISRRTFLKAAGTGMFATTMGRKAHAKTKQETALGNKLLDDALKAVRRRMDLQEKVKRYSDKVRERLRTKQEAFQKKEMEAIDKGKESELRNRLTEIVSMNQKEREKFLVEYLAKVGKATYLETEQMVVESETALLFINERMERIGKGEKYPQKKQDLENLWNMNALYTRMINQTMIALFDKIGPIEEEIILKSVE